MEKTLARQDPGINPLYFACRKHDVTYAQNPDNLSARYRVNNQLEQAAWERSEDVSVKEKAADWFVTTVMKGKQRFGMGCELMAPQQIYERSC